MYYKLSRNIAIMQYRYRYKQHKRNTQLYIILFDSTWSQWYCRVGIIFWTRLKRKRYYIFAAYYCGFLTCLFRQQNANRSLSQDTIRLRFFVGIKSNAFNKFFHFDFYWYRGAQRSNFHSYCMLAYVLNCPPWYFWLCWVAVWLCWVKFVFC